MDSPFVHTIPALSRLATYLHSSRSFPKTDAPNPYLVPFARLIASPTISNSMHSITGAKTSSLAIFIDSLTSTKSVGWK